MKYIMDILPISIFLSLVLITGGEVVLITGASSGIGYGVAKVLASNGYKIVATARRVAKLEKLVEEIKEMGGDAIAVGLDVTKEADYENAFATAEAAFGGVDHTVLNAGVNTQGLSDGTQLDTFPMDWAQTQLDVNVLGVIGGMKHSVLALRKRGGGSIILMSSVAAHFNRFIYANVPMDMTYFLPYAATKAAVDMLSRVGTFYQKEGIRVYGVKPAVFNSELTQHESDRSFGGDSTNFAAFNPFFFRVAGDPVHIGRTVLSLIDNSTQYESGSNICVDNDATWDSAENYRDIESPDHTTFAVTYKELRGYDGGPYTCQSQATCDHYNKKAAECTDTG